MWLAYTLVSVFILIMLLAWRPLWFMNTWARFSSVRMRSNLAYDLNPRHKLDVYLPKTPNSHLVLVFVHGGAWDDGHKNDYRFAGTALANAGFIVAVPTYRLYPEVQYPHFVDDVAKALGALPRLLSDIEVASDKGLDVVLIGHSAGAHTVAMLAHEQFAEVCVKGIVGLAGPYDLPLDDPLVVGKFDPVTPHEDDHPKRDNIACNPHDANPIVQAVRGMPPHLLIHGQKDVTVGPYHTQRMAEKLERLAVRCETHFYAQTNHRHLVGALSPLFRFLNPVYRDVIRFVRTLA